MMEGHAHVRQGSWEATMHYESAAWHSSTTEVSHCITYILHVPQDTVLVTFPRTQDVSSLAQPETRSSARDHKMTFTHISKHATCGCTLTELLGKVLTKLLGITCALDWNAKWLTLENSLQSKGGQWCSVWIVGYCEFVKPWVAM